MNRTHKTTIKKAVCFFGGQMISAIGLNISKASGLGISPVSSIDRVLELLTRLTLGQATMITYSIAVLLQIVILRKRFKLTGLLGILLAFEFSFFVDLFGLDPNAFGHLLIWLPIPTTYVAKLLYSLASVVIIGTGVYLYIHPNWIPLPFDGLNKAIAQVSGIKFGNVKTMTDVAIVCISITLQCVFLGGISSFFSDNVAVREGTVIAAIFVGQVVKVLDAKFTHGFDKWMYA